MRKAQFDLFSDFELGSDMWMKFLNDRFSGEVDFYWDFVVKWGKVSSFVVRMLFVVIK